MAIGDCITKLRTKLTDIQENKLPRDELAMSRLLKLLDGVKVYGGGSAGFSSVFDHTSTQIVDCIREIVDGRIERVLSAIEVDLKNDKPAA